MKRGAHQLLMISQVYPPDPAAVGQYLADALGELGRRGWKVRVLTADRGYDDPAQKFPREETADGVHVRRLPKSSFGKRSIAVRLAGMLSFLAQALARGLFTRDLAAVIVSTSPPMAGIVGWAIAGLRRVPLVYWVMDLNPDQAVASGRMRADALPVRIFNAANGRVLQAASAIIALDRFMEQRLRAKSVRLRRLAVIPPWPLEQYLSPVAHAANPFRREHALENKFVVMYSGNHSLVHPLDTLALAARALRDDPRFVFVFIGGGVGKAPLERAVAGLGNVRLLPYQPPERLRYSLSAADAHVVTMGEAMVGCVHPCKFYGAFAVGRPVLLVGPAECHVTDVFSHADCGWRIAHGDGAGLVALLLRLAGPAAAPELEAKARAGRELLERGFSRASLRGRWADEVEAATGVCP